LMEDPVLVAEMVRAAKARLNPTKSVSVKIRIHRDLAKTIEWTRLVEQAGVDFITVHGRMRSQRSSTRPNYEAIRTIREHVNVPVIANGDVYKLADVENIASLTGADGVMAARGILENPALFADHDVTPAHCVQRMLAFAVRCPIPFPLVVHHVSEMIAHMKGMTKRERKRLMECRDLVDLIDYIEEKWGLEDGSEAESLKTY